MASYDRWDRNDHDGDGDFEEPDGSTDHFQIVHAGVEQSAPLRWADGTLMRTRVQSYDSTFGFGPTESITLPRADALTTVPSSPGVPFFDDRARSYWDAVNPCNGVKVPHTGTRIELLWNSPDKLESIIMVRPS
ncbi:immune inhibitor A domain-containing protein [Streptomyces zaomyceticus]|uniref:immune inhibitor A domain-containing protein n=1 Tax=Streptomyces zaomyceticus TaxID=68286 RepID=UPI0038698E7B